MLNIIFLSLPQSLLVPDFHLWRAKEDIQIESQIQGKIDVLLIVSQNSVFLKRAITFPTLFPLFRRIEMIQGQWTKGMRGDRQVIWEITE